jgi:3-keto-5-aminohexanoate cleavage enzyme
MFGKVAIVAAVNGGMQQTSGDTFVPVSPEEIAEDATQAREAGAAIVHVHARDTEGKNTGDIGVYADIIRRIRAGSDILVQTTNGIGVRRDPNTGDMIWPTDAERLALLTIDPKPDLYGIAAGSTDFWHPAGGYLTETPYVNSPDFLRKTLPHVYAQGSTIEFELVEINVVHRLSRLADEGIIDRNADNLWMLHGGGIGNTPPTARALTYSRDEQERLFPNARWGVLGAGKAQFRMAALGLAMGCDTVRVGFEDNIFGPDGKPARRNRDLVAAVRKLAKAMGREIASPAEAREMFRLK